VTKRRLNSSFIRSILDSSTLLALIKGEEGSSIVEGLLGGIVMSSVNVLEVAAILADSAMPQELISKAIEPFVDSIVPFDFKYAVLCAVLKKSTKYLGLSLGDRNCISLGAELGLPIYTADKIWSELDSKFNIVLIR
jgi:hypothetical protein